MHGPERNSHALIKNNAIKCPICGPGKMYACSVKGTKMWGCNTKNCKRKIPCAIKDYRLWSESQQKRDNFF